MADVVRLGCLPDPAKGPGEKPDRDALGLLGAEPVPESASARHNFGQRLLQGGYNSCVANAGMDLLRADQIRQGADPEHVPLGSRWFGYYAARATHGATHLDEGTYWRAFFVGVARLGFPPESAWPYLDDLVDGKPRWSAMPSGDAFRLAFDQRARLELAYYSISGTGEERVLGFKRAIARGRGVGFGTEVSYDFVRDVLPEPILPPRDGDAIAGGHAMNAVAYDASGVWVRNTWRWGDSNGERKLSWDYIRDWRTRDIRVVETAPLFPGAR